MFNYSAFGPILTTEAVLVSSNLTPIPVFAYVGLALKSDPLHVQRDFETLIMRGLSLFRSIGFAIATYHP